MGMAAFFIPNGSQFTPRASPRALAIYDRSLSARAPGFSFSSRDVNSNSDRTNAKRCFRSQFPSKIRLQTRTRSKVRAIPVQRHFCLAYMIAFVTFRQAKTTRCRGVPPSKSAKNKIQQPTCAHDQLKMIERHSEGKGATLSISREDDRVASAWV